MVVETQMYDGIPHAFFMYAFGTPSFERMRLYHASAPHASRSNDPPQVGAGYWNSLIYYSNSSVRNSREGVRIVNYTIP